MAVRRARGTFASLDIGTSKVAAFVGQLVEEDEVEVLGMGVVPSEGVRTGAVNMVRDAAECVRASLAEAEATSGVRVKHVVVGIAGGEVSCRTLHSGDLVLGDRSREVLTGDVARLHDRVRAGALSEDEVLLHVEPQEYLLDGRTVTSDPVGMWGIRVAMRALVVTGSSAAVHNLRTCVQMAGAQVSELVLEPLASAEAVLGPDERDLGTALVDLGGGTSDVALFQRGAIRSSAVIGLGGELVTRDLALVLGTTREAAEELKRTVGLAPRDPGEDEETVEVPGLGDAPPRRVSASLVSEIIRARVEEILEEVSTVLQERAFQEPLAGGVVLTGGASKLEGLVPLARRLLRMPTRCGYPRRVLGPPELLASPEHATGLGLLRRAAASGQGSGPGPRRLGLWNWLKERWKELG